MFPSPRQRPAGPHAHHRPPGGAIEDGGDRQHAPARSRLRRPGGPGDSTCPSVMRRWFRRRAEPPGKRWPVERYRNSRHGWAIAARRSAVGADAERVFDRLQGAAFVPWWIERASSTSSRWPPGRGRRRQRYRADAPASAGGCASVALFPMTRSALCAPRPRREVLREPDLENLTTETVLALSRLDRRYLSATGPWRTFCGQSKMVAITLPDGSVRSHRSGHGGRSRRRYRPRLKAAVLARNGTPGTLAAPSRRFELP